MENMKNIFGSDEFIELAKKNMEFTMDLFKTNVKNSEEIMKSKVAEYFDYVNSNLEFLNENYEKAVSQNTGLADLYKENVEKIYKMSKDMMEKMK